MKQKCVPLTCLLAVLFLPGFAASAEDSAEAKPAPPPLSANDLDRAAEQLGSEKFALRESACRALLDHPSGEVMARLYELAAESEDAEVCARAGMLIPEVRDLLGDGLYSKDFYILGPLPFPDDDFQWAGENKPEWMRHATPLDKLPEIDLGAKYTIKFDKGKHQDNGQPGGETEQAISWQRPFKGGRGMLDIRALFPECPNYATAFMLTFVKSNGASRVRFWLGSDDGIGVWVNGACKHFNAVHRGLTKDQDTVDVDLQDGWNAVLIRVHQGWGGWSMTFRITDKNGRPWPDKEIDPDCGGQPRPKIDPPVLPPPEKKADEAKTEEAKPAK
ncbi:MAG: hypothetical protein HY291_10525 [Planctomycetes bacterium]|nr:hypothetical protein [Planctomycetota bacterium]